MDKKSHIESFDGINPRFIAFPNFFLYKIKYPLLKISLKSNQSIFVKLQLMYDNVHKLQVYWSITIELE